MRAVIGRPCDLAVVRRHDIAIHQQQTGSRIGNRVDGYQVEAPTFDPVAGGSDLPKPARGRDRGVGYIAGISARVNVAKVIRTWLALLEVSSKQIVLEDTLVECVVEEVELAGGLDCKEIISTYPTAKEKI